MKDGSLLVSLGDRGHRPNGQSLATHPGSIVRYMLKGLPLDNPFVGNQLALPEIYTFGNRNVQGYFGMSRLTIFGPQSMALKEDVNSIL